jgi:lipopolysaccharide biosynthesis glycosyltransferase
MLHGATRDSQDIDLVCCGDENYPMAMATMLYSAAANLPPLYRLRVFIIDGGLAISSRQRLQKTIGSLPNVDLQWRKVPMSRFEGLPTFGYLLGSMYLRLLMDEVLPHDLDRVIYLDADLLVEADLSELWRQDFGNSVVLAVRNYSRSMMRSHLPLPDVDETARRRGRYFNSGVLVINLKRWRDEHVGSATIEYIRQNRSIVEFPDQDGLNAVLFGKWGELDLSWNAQVHKLITLDQLGVGEMYEEIRRRREELLYRPRIRHYCGDKKPWHAGRFKPVRAAFVQYLHGSGWFNPIDLVSFHLRWFLATSKVAYKMFRRRLRAEGFKAAVSALRKAMKSDLGLHKP